MKKNPTKIVQKNTINIKRSEITQYGNYLTTLSSAETI